MLTTIWQDICPCIQAYDHSFAKYAARVSDKHRPCVVIRSYIQMKNHMCAKYASKRSIVVQHSIHIWEYTKNTNHGSANTVAKVSIKKATIRTISSHTQAWSSSSVQYVQRHFTKFTIWNFTCIHIQIISRIDVKCVKRDFAGISTWKSMHEMCINFRTRKKKIWVMKFVDTSNCEFPLFVCFFIKIKCWSKGINTWFNLYTAKPCVSNMIMLNWVLTILGSRVMTIYKDQVIYENFFNRATNFCISLANISKA